MSIFYSGKVIALKKDQWTLIGKAPIAFWAMHEEPITWTTDKTAPATAIRSVAGRTLRKFRVQPRLPAGTEVYARGCYGSSNVTVEVDAETAKTVPASEFKKLVD